MNLNLIASAIVGSFFAIINYKVIMLQSHKAAEAVSPAADDDEEDI